MDDIVFGSNFQEEEELRKQYDAQSDSTKQIVTFEEYCKLPKGIRGEGDRHDLIYDHWWKKGRNDMGIIFFSTAFICYLIAVGGVISMLFWLFTR